MMPVIARGLPVVSHCIWQVQPRDSPKLAWCRGSLLFIVEVFRRRRAARDNFFLFFLHDDLVYVSQSM